MSVDAWKISAWGVNGRGAAVKAGIRRATRGCQNGARCQLWRCRVAAEAGYLYRLGMWLLQMKAVALGVLGMQRGIEQMVCRRVRHGCVLHDQQQEQQ